LLLPRPSTPPLFPYTTLFRSFEEVRRRVAARADDLLTTARALARLDVFASLAEVAHGRGHVRPTVDGGDALAIVEGRHPVLEARDRKSTRLNSSHVSISYAVF